MILIDIPMPDRCGECKLMRCSKCIPMDSRNILDYQASKTKPEWCPLKPNRIAGHIETEIELCEGYMQTDSPMFNGEEVGVDVAKRLWNRHIEHFKRMLRYANGKVGSTRGDE